MFLYPTETVYALGVDPFDSHALNALYQLKGRESGKPVSLLVRTIDDIERYATLHTAARKVATAFLPGPLTLVVPALDIVPRELTHNGTIGFRISSDPLAQTIIATHMQQYNHPLTCTSANVSGEPTAATPTAILEQFKQFGRDTSCIQTVYNRGERSGTTSTVLGVTEAGELVIWREGSISRDMIEAKLQL